MSDDRTPEKKAADKALDDAVRAAFAFGNEGYLVTDAITVVAYTYYDEDGDGVSGHAILTGEGEAGHYRLVGLLDVARRGLIREYFSEDDE